MSKPVRQLVTCPVCARHVRSDERECPFCAAALLVRGPQRTGPWERLGRAALLAAGASATLMSACSNSVVPPYGTSPMPDASSMSDTADGGADEGGDTTGNGGG